MVGAGSAHYCSAARPTRCSLTRRSRYWFIAERRLGRPEQARLLKERVDFDPANVRVVRHNIENRSHQLLENPAQAARAGFVFDGDFRNLFEHFRVDTQLNAFRLENVDVLPVNRILRYAHDLDQHRSEEHTSELQS